MPTEPLILSGTVKDGVIVPDPGGDFPEGARVKIALAAGELAEELRSEFEAWDRARAHAWSMIDDWEREEENGSR